MQDKPALVAEPLLQDDPDQLTTPFGGRAVKGFFLKKLPGLRCALWGCFALAVLSTARDLQAQQPPADKPTVAVIPGRSERVAPLALPKNLIRGENASR